MHDLIENTSPYRWRALLPSHWARRFIRDRRHKQVLIVGAGDAGYALQRQAHASGWHGQTTVAVIDLAGNELTGNGLAVNGRAVHGLAVNGLTVDDLTVDGQASDHLTTLIHQLRADEVWIALSLEDTRWLPVLLSHLQQSPVDIRWAPNLSSARLLGQRSADHAGIPMINLNHVHQQGLRGLVKQVFDRAFALAVLLLLSPLLVGLAIAIRQSSEGPVLFRQPRLGLNGKPFNVYKFRSMRVHQEDDGQVTQAKRDDPRVTRIGRLMRRTSLDELPQFINVLLGQMSVVGPRPHALAHNDFYKQRLALYMQRHRVKPGITGWAQIHGCRGETDSDDKMARRVALDLHYIRHWSLWLDLKIIAWTALHGWTDGNAY